MCEWSINVGCSPCSPDRLRHDGAALDRPRPPTVTSSGDQHRPARSLSARIGSQRVMASSSFSLMRKFQGSIVRPMHLGTILRQQQPCCDDPVGTVQPDGPGTRVVLIRGFRARAEAQLLGAKPQASMTSPGLNESLLKPLLSSSRIGAELSKGPANRLTVFRRLFHDDGGVGIGPHITGRRCPLPGWALRSRTCGRRDVPTAGLRKTSPTSTRAPQPAMISGFIETSSAG